MENIDRQAKNIVIALKKGAEIKDKSPENARVVLGSADGVRDLFTLFLENEKKAGKSILNKKELLEYFLKLKDEGLLTLKYKQVVTEEALLEMFKKLRLKPKDKIMVHSSLLSIGSFMLRNGVNWKEEVEAFPALVVKVLQELITAEGVIMMPSFNHGKPFEKDGPGYYSPLETPTINGVVPEYFWRLKDVSRSIDPSHPFAVWGKNARDYVKDHHKLVTMGDNSPLNMIEKGGGKALLIDAPAGNTFHHIVEMTNRTPCLGERTEEYTVKLPNNQMVKCRTWGWRNGGCKITDPVTYQKTMADRGLIKKEMIGKAKITVFDLKDCRKVIEEYFEGKIEGYGGCKVCKVRPRTIPETVESDWDVAAKKVKKDTTAFIGDC